MKDKSAKILLDVPVEDGVLGFDNYRDALNTIIKSSEPHFTIGIFGGWGTGKTTLMKMMKKQLDTEGEVTVWFNPWQYEKEEHLIIPLLQTIQLELKDRKVTKSETIQKLGKSVLALVSGLSAQIPLVGVGISAKDAIETYQKLFESKNLSSIYFDLNRQLSEIINELKTKKKESIVIFIDDLDRCLPDKALQVLESAKGFLDMDGYVFVLGLSKDIIEKCVDAKYGTKSGTTGSEYLRKMIQVPFTLPDLRHEEMTEYVKNLKEGIKGSEVEKYVGEYMDIIVRGLEHNPREIKRFINNFILVSQISQEETEPEKLLALLIVQFRWEAFYRALVMYKRPFLDQTREIAGRIKKLKEEKDIKEAKEKWSFFDLIWAHLKDEHFVRFLQEAGTVLFAIQDLDPYIHFSKSVVLEKEEVKKERSKRELIDLLRKGRIQEFNSVRPYPHVDLSSAGLIQVNLSEVNLTGANLSEANLTGADLSGADLSEARLIGADLSTTDLRKAVLTRAYMRRARLRDAIMVGALCSDADFTRANLTGCVLDGAYLRRVVLRQAVVVRASFEHADLTGADLSGANLHKAVLPALGLREIVVDNHTAFELTVIRDVQNLSREIGHHLHIEIEGGVARATNKWLLEKRESDKGKT